MEAMSTERLLRFGALVLALVLGSVFLASPAAQAQEASVSSVISCIFQPGCSSEDLNTDGRTSAADLVAAIRAIGLPPLDVAIEINPDPVRPGETMRVAVTVSNRGLVSLTGATLDVPVPMHVNSLYDSVVEGDCPSTTCDQGETVHFNVGDLPAGRGVVYTLPFVVSGDGAAPPDGTSIDVHASASAGSLSATAMASALVQAGRALDLAMNPSADPVAPGAELTYTLTFGNSSAGLAQGAALNLPLPPGTAFVSATDGGVLDGDTVTWDLGNLNPGDGGARRVVVQVDSQAVLGGVTAAQAQISDVRVPADSTRASAVTRIETNNPLILSMEINPDPVQPGQTLDVGLTATNSGPVDLPAVQVVLRQPDNLNAVYVSQIDGQCPSTTCDRSENAVFDLDTLKAGFGSTTTYPPIVSGGTAAGTVITLEAIAHDQSGRRVRIRRSVLVQQDPTWQLALDASRDPVAPGSELTYTLTFGNRGSGLAPGAVLQMPVPPGTTFVSATGGGALDNGVVFWDLAALPPGDGGVRRLVVQTSPDAVSGGVVRAGASIADTNAPADRARASALTRVESGNPLTLSMEVNPDPVQPSETLDVGLTTTNRGQVDLSAADVRMRQPDGLNPVYTSQIDGQCPSTTCDRGENAFFDLGTLKAGRGSTTTYPPIVLGSVASGTVITFEAFAREQNGHQVRARRSVLVQAEPALDLALNASRDPAEAGTDLTYTLTFGNHGLGQAPGALLEFPVPAGTTFLSATGGGTLGDGVVSWDLSALPPGDGGTRQMVVQIDPQATDGDVVRAEAAISDTNSPADRARASTVTRIESDTPLGLSLEINPDPVQPSETLDVGLTASNRGAVDLFTGMIRMRQPDNLNAVYVSQIEGQCPSTTCDRGENAIFDLGTLKAGRGWTTTYPPIVLGTVASGTVITFEAFAYEQTGHLVRARRSVLVQSDPALNLAVNASTDPAAPGDDLTYTLTFGNQSPGAAPGALLQMPVPPGTTFVSATGGGVVADNAVMWDVGTLSPGTGGVRQLVVQVDPQVLDGAVVRAEASISDTNTPADRARASTVTRIESDTPLTLSLEINPDPVQPSETLDVGLTASNRGQVDLFTTTIQMRQPDNLNAVYVSQIEGQCPSTTCDRGENAIFDLGALKAGRGWTTTYPPIVLGTVASGTVITFEAFAFEQTGHLVRVRRSVLVQSIPALALALDASPDPVQPDGQLTYTLTFGNRGTGAAPGALLEMLLPAGTTFIGATGGGTLAGGVVTWNLDTLAPGDGGTQGLMVQVGAMGGDVVRAEAAISDTNAPADLARASAVTRVESGNPLSMSVQIDPDPVMAAETLGVVLSAGNSGPVDLFGTGIRMRHPDGLNSVHVSQIDGTCPSTTCDRGENVSFDLGTLTTGQTVMESYPPKVQGAQAVPAGTLITFEAFASDNSGDQARGRSTVRVAAGP